METKKQRWGSKLMADGTWKKVPLPPWKPKPKTVYYPWRECPGQFKDQAKESALRVGYSVHELGGLEVGVRDGKYSGVRDSHLLAGRIG